MPSTDTCPDCSGPLDRMRLHGGDTVGSPTVVSDTDDGFLSSVRTDEVLTPVPYVCADCRRIVWYAEE